MDSQNNVEVEFLLSEKQEEKVQGIMSKMACPKNFECYHSGFRTLTPVKDTGIETLIECQNHQPKTCPFSLSFGYSHFCKCPLRLYISKHLKR